MERVTKSPDGCWLWNRSRTKQGYGDFRLNKKHYLAHRASYEVFIAPIPTGMHVLHKCDIRNCVNPDHLFLGTNQDNIADSVSKGRRKGIKRVRPSGLDYKWNADRRKRQSENMRKLKDDLRLKISVEYSGGSESHGSLANKYGVSRTTIHNILHGR